jgi:hypothetical protein
MYGKKRIWRFSNNSTSPTWEFKALGTKISTLYIITFLAHRQQKPSVTNTHRDVKRKQWHFFYHGIQRSTAHWNINLVVHLTSTDFKKKSIFILPKTAFRNIKDSGSKTGYFQRSSIKSFRQDIYVRMQYPFCLKQVIYWYKPFRPKTG